MRAGDEVLVQDAPLFLGFASLEWGYRGGQRGVVVEVDDPLVLVRFRDGEPGWFPVSLLEPTCDG
jgi:hypothetical protein